MRVLAITNLFPSEREPTRGLFNLYGFGALGNYCQVRVISPIPWWNRLDQPGSLFNVPEEYTGGITAIYPTYWSIPRATSMHAGAMHSSLKAHVKRIRPEFPFDIVLAAWAYPDAVAASKIADEAGCPLVTMTLGSDINELARHDSMKPQIQKALARSARVMAVSGALRDRIVALGVPSNKVVVQHNGVDGDQFQLRKRSEARLKLGLPQYRKTICFVGNFKPEKGTDVIVEAMDHLVHRMNVDADLLLVGSGPEEEKMRAAVAARKLRTTYSLRDDVRTTKSRPISVRATCSACQVTAKDARTSFSSRSHPAVR